MVSTSVTVQIQAFLNHVYQSTVYRVAKVDSLAPSPRKGYILTTSDGQYFVLKTAPSISTRLLRYESSSPADESHALERLLAQNSSPPVPSGRNLSLLTLSGLDLSLVVPRLLSTSYDSTNPLLGPYLLRSYIAGVSLASISHRLTSYERGEIDKKIGFYLRIAVGTTASQFGTLNRVAGGSGYDTWRKAFHFFLEAALRDAEDAALTLPYQSIRYWVNLHMHHLDAITQPRLVPLRAGTPETVLIDESRKIVVGILSWGDTIWGDPALGQVFELATSPEFWIGFGGQQSLIHEDGGHERRGQM
jgi:uncharacterized protein YggT (Ycf19 family)